MISGMQETWIGLINPKGVVCYNSECDGQVLWNDGTRFKYDTSIYSLSLKFNEGTYCMRFRMSEYNDRHCLLLIAGLCEIKCF